MPHLVLRTPSGALVLTGPPAAPSDLTGVALSQTTIRFSWTLNSENEKDVRLWLSDDAGATFVPINLGPGAETVDATLLTPGTSYRAYVVALGRTIASAPSNTVTVATQNPDPPVAGLALDVTSGFAPLAVTATNTSTGVVTGYTIDWGDGTVDSLLSHTYTVAGNYTAVATASNGGGSDVTDPISVTVTAAPVSLTTPGNPTVSAFGSSQINVTVPAHNGGLAQTQIWRRQGVSGSTSLLTTLPAGTLAYSDPGLAANTTYGYQLRATDGAVLSGFSAIVSATTADVFVPPPPPPPPPPGTVGGIDPVAVSFSENQILFTYGGANPSKFLILRNHGVGGYRVIAEVPGTDRVGYDRQVESGAEYGYAVAPYSTATGLGTFASAGSPVASLSAPRTPPAAPSNLTLVAESDTAISCKWDTLAIPTDLAHYLEICPSAAPGTWRRVTLGPCLFQHSVRGAAGNLTLAANTSYDVRVALAVTAELVTAYSPIATVTTMGAGQVLSPTGRNPKMGWTGHWQKAWSDARSAWLSNPGANTLPVKTFAWLKSSADVTNTPGTRDADSGLYVMWMYQLTNDPAWAAKWVVKNAMMFGTSATVSEAGTTTTMKLDATAFPLTGTNAYQDRYVVFTSGANRDLIKVIWAYNGSTRTATFNSGGDVIVAPQPGDTYTVIQLPVPNNSIREEYIGWNQMRDWMYPALSTDQKRAVANWLNCCADRSLGRSTRTYTGGTNPGDSDQAFSQYFGMLLTDNQEGNPNPRTPLWATSARNTVQTGVIPVGGPDPTGVGPTSVRNMIEYYARAGRGGDYLEGGEYAPSTMSLITTGLEFARTALGECKFPAMRRTVVEAALHYIVHQLTPDKAQRIEWGDEERPRVVYQSPYQVTAACFAGITEGLLRYGPYVNWQVRDWFLNPINAFGYSARPYGRFFALLNPGARTTPAGDADSPLTTRFYGAGMGCGISRTDWGTSASAVQLRGIQLQGVDHAHNQLAALQHWKAGEWVLTYPIGYGAGVVDGFACNSPLYGGLSSALGGYRGPCASEFTAGYSYLCASTGGQMYTQPYYQPPLTYLHEGTRSQISFLHVPGADVTVIYDRANLQNPRLMPGGLTRYRGAPSIYNGQTSSGDHYTLNNALALFQSVFHSPVAATDSNGNQLDWTTPGGQKCRVQLLYPATCQFTTQTDVSAGITTNYVNASEQKWLTRLYPNTPWPSDTAMNFYEFVQVFSAGGASTLPTVALFNGSAGEAARGVLVSRTGIADEFVVFGAKQVSRVQWSGYTITWTSVTITTNAHLLDLDPKKSWTVVLDGGSPAALTVSGAGVGNLTVSGAGSHTIQVVGV